MFRRIRKNSKVLHKEFENFQVETRGDSSAMSPPAVSVVDKKLIGQRGITLL